jgi:hypothetical protein
MDGRPIRKRCDPTMLIRSGHGIGRFLGGGGLAVGVTLAVVVGLQLGAMPWRFRKELWQLQGALAGGLVGYVVGWGVGRSRRAPDDELN